MMTTFGPAAEGDVLALVIQIAVLLFTARLFGEIAQRFGQPAVIGEILAGVVLGNSLLSGAFPAIGEFIVPQTAIQGHLLEVVSLLGAMFLLVITGLETDLPLIRRHIKTAFTIGVFELPFTFLLGFLLAWKLPDYLLGDVNQRLVFQLFVATAISISAIPVMAKMLLDLNLMRRNIGQTIMTVGMIDDTIAWILLSIVLSLVGGGAVSGVTLLFAAGKILLFMGVSFTLGRFVLVRTFNWVQENSISHEKSLTLIVVFAFAFGAVAQGLHIEAVLGAFIVGIIFGTIKRMPTDVIQKLESITMGIFAPIFFAVAGLKVNLTVLGNRELLLIALVVLGIATAGKLIGAFVGAKVAKMDNWHALAYGSALNARGAVEIIIASIGLKIGILAIDMYTIIVIMAISTSIMAPFMLRFAVSRIKPDEEEQKRLTTEKLAETSFFATVNRVLLPIRLRSDGSNTHTVAAGIVNRMARKHPLEATLMTISSKENETTSLAALQKLASAFPVPDIQKKVFSSTNPAETILDEAQRSYDLIILGATERSGLAHGNLFNPMVDYLVRTSPTPTMVIQGGQVDLNWQPNRILVPVSGTAASRNAVDVALNLASTANSEVIFIHVIREEPTDLIPSRRNFQVNDEQIGWQIIRDLRKWSESMKVKTTGLVRRGPSVDAVILDVAAKNGIDLIALGTSVRPGTDRLFLGPRVERILYMAQCPVMILNS